MSSPPDHPPPGSVALYGLAPAIAALQVLDLGILMSTAAGDRGLARELMSLFIQTTQPIYIHLALAMQRGDCAASQRESHALCGVAGLIGAIALVPILKEIEVLAFRCQDESVIRRLPALTLAFASITAAVTLTLTHFDASGEAIS